MLAYITQGFHSATTASHITPRWRFAVQMMQQVLVLILTLLRGVNFSLTHFY